MLIERETNTDVVLSMVALQNQEFDLHEFFGREVSSYFDQGACGFITRKQSFYCDALENHGLVFENVCGSIFEGDEPLVRNEYYTVNRDLFLNKDETGINNSLYANLRFGVINIKMLTTSGAYVWLPDKINSFQKEKLLEFCAEIKEINQSRVEMGLPELDVFFCVFNGTTFNKYMDIDEFISKIDNFVDDNVKLFTENMVSDYVSGKRR